MQMPRPNVVTDAWPSTKTPCEQILSLVLTSFDRSPLSVLELTALGGASLHFYQMQWPRFSILFDLESAPLDLESEEGLASKLERLGERLRSPAVARAALVEGANCFRVWAEEDRCRAAWALAVMLRSSDWEELKNRDYLVRFLASGLVAPAPWASMSTAAAMWQLVQVCHDGCHVHGLLAEVGVGEVLVQLIQHTSIPVQQVALKAIVCAGEVEHEGGDCLGLSGTNVIPAIISIAQLGCYLNQPVAVEAIGSLALGSDAKHLKVVIPDVLEFLVHERDEMKHVAAQALLRLMFAGDDFVITACQHGCIPKMIDACWRATGLHQYTLLLCLQRMTFGEPHRKMALQHQILPLLFQSLQDWKHMREQHLQRLVLAMLLAYPSHVKDAFLQESPARRTSAICQMTQIALEPGNPNSASAEELLEQLAPGVLG